MSARTLQVEAQFLYIPGCMIISFDDSAAHVTEVKMVRATQGLDLGKLRNVHRIYKNVAHDVIGADQAMQQLNEVMQQKVTYSPYIVIIMSGLASACVGPFAFGARLIDLPISFMLGGILGAARQFSASRSDLYSNIFEILAAMITSFFARLFGSIFGGEVFCFSAVAQSSIVLILPGYTVREFASLLPTTKFAY